VYVARGQVVDIRAQVADEFGELERRIQEFKPVRDRHEALKKQIQTWFEQEPADQPASVEGKLYLVQASARANQRKVKSIASLFRRLGKALFLEVATVPFTAIDRVLPAEEHEKFVSEERTGSRTIKAVLRAPAGKTA
jgi:hypothetical protein